MTLKANEEARKIIDLKTRKPIHHENDHVITKEPHFENDGVTRYEGPIKLNKPLSLTVQKPTLRQTINDKRISYGLRIKWKTEPLRNLAMSLVWAHQRRQCVKLIAELNAVALRLNAEKEFDVFVSYSGHVDSIDVRVHLGGWMSEDDRKKRPYAKAKTLTILSGTLPSDRYSNLRPKHLRAAIEILRQYHRMNDLFTGG